MRWGTQHLQRACRGHVGYSKQVLIDVWVWVLDTELKNTNAIEKPLVHMLFCQLNPPNLLGSDLGALIHLCGVKMMSLCHSWSWQPPQTASCIHVNHIQTVWAHWYAVHRHTVSSSLTQLYSPYLAQTFGYVVTCGVKMMSFGHGWGWQPPQTVPPSILDKYKVFKPIDMLSKGIW